MIYIAQFEDGTIKIGLTNRPVRDRLYWLAQREEQELVLLGTLPGKTLHDERLVLRLFSSSLIRGREWFRPSREIMAFVRSRKVRRPRPPLAIRGSGLHMLRRSSSREPCICGKRGRSLEYRVFSGRVPMIVSHCLNCTAVASWDRPSMAPPLLARMSARERRTKSARTRGLKVTEIVSL